MRVLSLWCSDSVVSAWLRAPVTLTLLSAFIPVALRLLLLPVIGTPAPENTDEFVHLLNAEIYTRGNLAEKPHPLSHYLETIYVLQRPAYAGIYPPGQGLVLALGILCGHPWIGVLLSCALAGGCLYWFLSALFPAPWAFAASVLCGIRWFTVSYWGNSYFGGPLVAFGALLLAGSLLRLVRKPNATLSLTAALGWSCIWLVRPFESLAVLAAVISFILAHRRTVARTLPLRLPLVWPALLCIAAAMLFTGLHNLRVTGSAFKLPYQQAQEQYGVPQNPLFLPVVADPGLRQSNLRQVYLWQLEARQAMLTWPRGVELALQKPWFLFADLFGPVLLFAVVAIWDCGGRSRRRMALVLTIVLLAPTLTYPFAASHYSAACAPLAAFFAAEAMRRLSHKPSGLFRRSAKWKWSVVLLVGLASLADASVFRLRSSMPEDRLAYQARRQVIATLEAMPGRHLVLVRYGSNHSFREEWVFNAADIDSSRIIWAVLPEDRPIEPLLTYFRSRAVWRLDADQRPAKLTRLSSPLLPAQSSGVSVR
jgi:hypothetical protein